MPFLSKEVGRGDQTYYQEIESGGDIEARLGRRDGEAYLYIKDADGTVREVGGGPANNVRELQRAASIINKLSADGRAQEETAADDGDADDDAGDDRAFSPMTDRVLPESFGLQPTDPGDPDSELATDLATEAGDAVLGAADGTFGTGPDVRTPGGELIESDQTPSPGGEFTTERSILKLDGEPFSGVYPETGVQYVNGLPVNIGVGLGAENIGAGLGGVTEQTESAFSDATTRTEQELAAAQAAANAAEEARLALEAKVDELTQAFEASQSPEAIAELVAQFGAQFQEQLGADAGQASTTVTDTPGTAAASVINPGDALTNVPVAEQTYSSNTLQGGQMQQAASISKGASEDAALDYLTKGVRGTIMTTPGGLITDPDDPNLRPRRGLIG